MDVAFNSVTRRCSTPVDYSQRSSGSEKRDVQSHQLSVRRLNSGYSEFKSLSAHPKIGSPEETRYILDSSRKDTSRFKHSSSVPTYPGTNCSTRTELVVHEYRSIAVELQQYTWDTNSCNDLRTVPELGAPLTSPYKAKVQPFNECPGVELAALSIADKHVDSCSIPQPLCRSPESFDACSPGLAHDLFFESSAVIVPPYSSPVPLPLTYEHSTPLPHNATSADSEALLKCGTFAESAGERCEESRKKNDTDKSSKLNAERLLLETSEVQLEESCDSQQFSTLLAFINGDYPVHSRAAFQPGPAKHTPSGTGAEAKESSTLDKTLEIVQNVPETAVKCLVPSIQKSPKTDVNCLGDYLCACFAGCQHKAVRTKDYVYASSSGSECGDFVDIAGALDHEHGNRSRNVSPADGWKCKDIAQRVAPNGDRTPDRSTHAFSALGSNCNLPKLTSPYKMGSKFLTYTVQSSRSERDDQAHGDTPMTVHRSYQDEVPILKQFSLDRCPTQPSLGTLPECVLTPGKWLSPLITTNPRWLSGPLSHELIRDIRNLQAAEQNEINSKATSGLQQIEVPATEGLLSKPSRSPTQADSTTCQGDMTRDMDAPQAESDMEMVLDDYVSSSSAASDKRYSLKLRLNPYKRTRGEGGDVSTRAKDDGHACWENRTRYSCRNTVTSIEQGASPGVDVGMIGLETQQRTTKRTPRSCTVKQESKALNQNRPTQRTRCIDTSVFRGKRREDIYKAKAGPRGSGVVKMEVRGKKKQAGRRTEPQQTVEYKKLIQR
ncbi:hypothetical protein SARC_09548 [Sphaeroforma arctica JP610]|uniref:Uncharacterized protein n=1 Tax=Sphaeroforma arctica JP610 TaxID=667725 RepID=A0A0L0FMK8_9EUKA|nr:hypothetical protein SARC_09548 [Sphaeroforma arctica JP610]KNC78004.1 hypothetical protein SARC_09548 [Sphaeroforma arctica JP610]|eukprot:XP_014151906.1 hypothetical protein SARC_09548 [Sphaeroforma arctica JP610]